MAKDAVLILFSETNLEEVKNANSNGKKRNRLLA